MTVVVVIIWWGSSFSLWSGWDAWTDGSDSLSEEMSVNLNEKREIMMIQTIVYRYAYLFFLLVVKSFGWPFCSAWTPEV